MKTCSRCREEKATEGFPLRKDQPDGLHFWCMPCKREKNREYSDRYRAANLQKKRANGTAWQRRNRVSVSESARRYKYGLTNTEIVSLIEAQQGACALCRTALGDIYHIDHDHSCCPSSKTCGRCIRGVLCRRCNLGLGQFNDDPDLLAAAAAYALSLRNVIPLVDQTS